MANDFEESLTVAAILIAEKVREIATRDGVTPVDTGDLRKAHRTEITQRNDGISVAISNSLPYARAVHDGRPALTIRPKKKKALYWKGAAHPVKAVHQKARKGNPYFTNSVEILEKEGFGFLDDVLGDGMARELEQALKDFKKG